MAMAVYPGSFDPITLGHIDIIRRIQPILGEITLVISNSSTKKSLFTADERKHLAEKALKGVPGVTVAVHEGLTVDYVKGLKARVIVRGLRAVSDYEYELVMANMNKKLAPNVETMIVFASPEFYYVSSNTVKEVAMNGGSVKNLVPPNVARALREKFAGHLGKLRERQKASAAKPVIATKTTAKVAPKAAPKVTTTKKKARSN
jgi:pantetheine-phosphate adenylyltransferase